jgi:flagellar hook protein FlgE
VDLAEQFTEMIIAQRGFQASARVITVADQLLNEVTQLKR